MSEWNDLLDTIKQRPPKTFDELKDRLDELLVHALANQKYNASRAVMMSKLVADMARELTLREVK